MCIFGIDGAMRDTASAQGGQPFQEALGDVCQSLARRWLMGVTPGASYRMAQTSSLEKSKISKTHFVKDFHVYFGDPFHWVAPCAIPQARRGSERPKTRFKRLWGMFAKA